MCPSSNDDSRSATWRTTSAGSFNCRARSAVETSRSVAWRLRNAGSGDGGRGRGSRRSMWSPVEARQEHAVSLVGCQQEKGATPQSAGMGSGTKMWRRDRSGAGRDPAIRRESPSPTPPSQTPSCRYGCEVCGLIASITCRKNSSFPPPCQRHTMTRSWSGETKMVLLPAPCAWNELVGSVFAPPRRVEPPQEAVVGAVLRLGRRQREL